MQRIKNFLFYSWWINFWVILLIVVMMWERPMIRFIGPLAFVAFVGYAFYAMLITKPKEETPTVPEKESPTVEEQSKVGSSE